MIKNILKQIDEILAKVDGDHMDDDDKWKAIAHIKSKVDAIYKKLDNEKTESWLRS